MTLLLFQYQKTTAPQKVDKNPTSKRQSHRLLQAIRAQGVGVSQRGDPEGEMQGPFGEGGDGESLSMDWMKGKS